MQYETLIVDLQVKSVCGVVEENFLFELLNSVYETQWVGSYGVDEL